MGMSLAGAERAALAPFLSSMRWFLELPSQSGLHQQTSILSRVWRLEAQNLSAVRAMRPPKTPGESLPGLFQLLVAASRPRLSLACSRIAQLSLPLSSYGILPLYTRVSVSRFLSP